MKKQMKIEEFRKLKGYKTMEAARLAWLSDKTPEKQNAYLSALRKLLDEAGMSFSIEV